MGDLQWRNSDLREQLVSAIGTLVKLRDRCELVKNKILFSLDQGQGLTHEQLVELNEEINKLFPRRTRVTCPRDTNGDGDCGRLLCPHCGASSLDSSL